MMMSCIYIYICNIITLDRKEVEFIITFIFYILEIIHLSKTSREKKEKEEEEEEEVEQRVKQKRAQCWKFSYFSV